MFVVRIKKVYFFNLLFLEIIKLYVAHILDKERLFVLKQIAKKSYGTTKGEKVLITSE